MSVSAAQLPQSALLQRYHNEPHYTDCFSIRIAGVVGLDTFINAFYTTRLFRLERMILTIALRQRISDDDAALLASDEREHFAAWTVEARANDQILMKDIAGRTRSWLQVAADSDNATTLLFGSAVLARGKKLSPVIRATIPLHRWYSRALLNAATRQLAKTTQ